MEFNLNDYRGNYVMHCKTEEEAESFCRFLHQNGRRWCNGDSYLEFNSWDNYERETVYCFNEGTYCSIEYARDLNYGILEWSDFMEEVCGCSLAQSQYGRQTKGDIMNIQLDKQALMPVRAHETDAGLDLLSPVETVIPAHGAVTVDTGVHIELPPNTAGFLKSKSGLNVKHGITSEGVIDVGYTGSVAVKLYNHSGMDYTVRRGDKISQLVVVKIDTPDLVLVDKLTETERGEGGFGSTGR